MNLNHRDKSLVDESELSGAIDDALSLLDGLDNFEISSENLPSFTVSDQVGLAMSLLTRWSTDIEASFYIDADESDVDELLDINTHALVGSFGAAIGHLGTWAVSPHDYLLPVSGRPDLAIPFDNLQDIAQGSALGFAELLRVIVLEAIVVESVLDGDKDSPNLRSLWRQSMVSTGVDGEMFLSRGWRPNTFASSWNDQMTIIDESAMIRALVPDERLPAITELGMAMCLVARQVDRISARALARSKLEHWAEALGYLNGRRRAAHSLEVYLLPCFGVRLAPI